MLFTRAISTTSRKMGKYAQRGLVEPLWRNDGSPKDKVQVPLRKRSAGRVMKFLDLKRLRDSEPYQPGVPLVEFVGSRRPPPSGRFKTLAVGSAGFILLELKGLVEPEMQTFSSLWNSRTPHYFWERLSLSELSNRTLFLSISWPVILALLILVLGDASDESDRSLIQPKIRRRWTLVDEHWGS